MYTVPESTIVILFVTLVAVCFIFFHGRSKKAARRAQMEDLANRIIGSSRNSGIQDFTWLEETFETLQLEKEDFQILGKERYHEVLDALTSLEWRWMMSQVLPNSGIPSPSLSQVVSNKSS